MRPAECLVGLELDGGWKVISQRTPAPHSTGGRFSVGYIVGNDSGKHAYLKALDFSEAFQSPDPARVLQAMTEAYNFERDLLAKCKQRRLNRIVTPLADGIVKVPGNFGLLEKVCYLIFDHAKGDIRDELAQFTTFDLAWSLRSLHHTATGLRQLHSTKIAHQDLKPSNVLVYQDSGSKISDLGRASDEDRKFRTDELLVPGDVGYAPPELFYPMGKRNFEDRYLADLYLLGSLFFFYFSSCSATQGIRAKIKGFKGINFTGNDFANDLPYIRQAFVEALMDLERQVRPIAGILTDRMIEIVAQLCEPDPKRRGDPLATVTKVPRYSLERYVSRIDLLARKAEYNLL